MKLTFEVVLNIDVDKTLPLVNEEGEILDDAQADDEVLEKTQNPQTNYAKQLIVPDVDTQPNPQVSEQYVDIDVGNMNTKVVNQKERSGEDNAVEEEQDVSFDGKGDVLYTVDEDTELPLCIPLDNSVKWTTITVVLTMRL